MSEKQNSGLTVAVLVIPNLIVCLASTVSYSLPYMFGSLIGRVLCTYLFFLPVPFSLCQTGEETWPFSSSRRAGLHHFL